MKLVILDRDGVINQDSDNYIKSPEEWIPIPNSADAIAFLNQCQYCVAVATNQSGISRGLFGMQELNQIHSKMLKHIRNSGGEIEGIWFCPHSEKEECHCRKPKTGLIEDILKRLGSEIEEMYMVGDSLRDLQCIEAMGGIPVLVLTGKGKKTLIENKLPANTLIYDDLWAFSQEVCNPGLNCTGKGGEE